MATEWQAPPNADVILRASGGTEFHAHKLVLSIASSVFRDMFSVPQPPSTTSSQLPIADVNDPPEVFEMFLRFIYPIPNPPINDIETLASLLRLADKYDAKAVLDAHKEYLPSMYVDSPPIHIYAILCVCGRKKDAEAAARRVSFTSLASLSGPLLHLMTIEHYQRLVRFMVARDTEMRKILNRHRESITDIRLLQCCNDAHRLYSGIIVATLQAAFEANPCVQVGEALGLVSSAPLTLSACHDQCKYNVQGLQRYAEGLLRDLTKMAQTLPWGG
jgi:hypothetical protein